MSIFTVGERRARDYRVGGMAVQTPENERHLCPIDQVLDVAHLLPASECGGSMQASCPSR
jgi:hypothetical protein